MGMTFGGMSFGVIESTYDDLGGGLIGGVVGAVIDIDRHLELVAPLAGGGLGHRYRDKDGWHDGATFGGGTHYESASLLQSNFGADDGNGNLEVVARTGTEVHQFYRDPKDGWQGPTVLEVGPLADRTALVAGGSPSFVLAKNGNFELVTAGAVGGPLDHYYRANDQNGYPWYKSTDGFGTNGDSLVLERADGRLMVLSRGAHGMVSHVRGDDGGWWSEDVLVDGSQLPSAGVSIAACRSRYTGNNDVGAGGANIEVMITGPGVSGVGQHYWCDNSNPDHPVWHRGTDIGLPVPSRTAPPAAAALVARWSGTVDVSYFVSYTDGSMYQWDRGRQSRQWGFSHKV